MSLLKGHVYFLKEKKKIKETTYSIMYRLYWWLDPFNQEWKFIDNLWNVMSFGKVHKSYIEFEENVSIGKYDFCFILYFVEF